MKINQKNKRTINKKKSFKRISLMVLIVAIIIIRASHHSVINDVALDFSINSIDKYNRDSGLVVASYDIKNLMLSIADDGDDAEITMVLKTNVLASEKFDGCYIHYSIVDAYDNQVYENKIWFPSTDNGSENEVHIVVKNLKRFNDTGYSLVKIRGFSVEEDEESDPTGY